MKELYINTQFGKVYVNVKNENKEKVLVLLHGWGMMASTFEAIIHEINHYHVVAIDFLGFGKSDIPKVALSLNDYVLVLHDILNEICPNKPVVLLGHSFGGRVAIRYSVIYEVEKVVLVSAKAYRSKGWKHFIKVARYKVKKWFYYCFSKKRYHTLRSKSGSSDYQRAVPIMKDTMKKIVNYDLKKQLRKIRCKVVVMGSLNDDVVAYKETVAIYKNINEATLYPFYESTHFCYLTEKNKFIRILRSELNI